MSKTLEAPRNRSASRGTGARRQSRSAKPTAPAVETTPRAPRRGVVVFITLIGVLTFTAALLKALSPAPLVPEGAKPLMAVAQSPNLDAIFKTPVAAGPWKTIYIHSSRSNSGNIASLSRAAGGLSDHFVIGNGHGAADGQILQTWRWKQQASAIRAPGGDSDCLSICLIGDLDRHPPTAAQQQQLIELLNELQAHFQISADHIWMGDNADSKTPWQFLSRASIIDQLQP